MGGTIGAIRLYPPSITNFRVKGLNSGILVQRRVKYYSLTTTNRLLSLLNITHLLIRPKKHPILSKIIDFQPNCRPPKFWISELFRTAKSFYIGSSYVVRSPYLNKPREKRLSESWKNRNFSVKISIIF